LLPWRGGLVAHADQRQLLLEAVGHAQHHVVHQLAHGAAHGVGFARFVGGDEGQLAAFVAHLDQGVLGSDSVPPLPLTLIWSSLMATSTPWGTATGIFPTRDMFLSFP
jgi:hypothetical protein